MRYLFPECAASSKDIAEADESMWEIALSNKAHAKNAYRLLLRDYQVNSIDVNEFINKKFELLQKYKKSLWYLERFSQEESKQLKRFYFDADKIAIVSHNCLKNGDINKFIELYFLSYEIYNKLNTIRDDHIRENLRSVEFDIRKRYPYLSDKEKIVLSIDIGCSHKISDINFPIIMHVHKLSDENIYEKIQNSLQDGKYMEDLRCELLLDGALDILRSRGRLVDEKYLAKMSESEIINYLHSEDLIKQ